MPKKTGTRRHIAADVYDQMKTGPHDFGLGPLFGANSLGIDNLPELTHEQREAVLTLVRRNYATWVNCWIIPDVSRLCPEINALRIAEQLVREKGLHNPK